MLSRSLKKQDQRYKSISVKSSLEFIYTCLQSWLACHCLPAFRRICCTRDHLDKVNTTDSERQRNETEQGGEKLKCIVDSGREIKSTVS